MAAWYEEFRDLFGSKIVLGKMSTQRITRLTKLSPEAAAALALFCRKGQIKDKRLK